MFIGLVFAIFVKTMNCGLKIQVELRDEKLNHDFEKCLMCESPEKRGILCLYISVMIQS
jgi:hypothetical protein